MDDDSDDDDDDDGDDGDDDSADGGQMVPECLAHQKWGRSSCLELEPQEQTEGKVDGVTNTPIIILVK